GKGPTGWIMPAYIAGDRDRAERNGEEAVVEYLLLSSCDYLVHNGSGLARTVLLNAPQLPHTNTHRKEPFRYIFIQLKYLFTRLRADTVKRIRGSKPRRKGL